MHNFSFLGIMINGGKLYFITIKKKALPK